MESGKGRKKQKSAPKSILDALRVSPKMAAGISHTQTGRHMQPVPSSPPVVSDSDSDPPSCAKSSSAFSDNTEAILARFDIMLQNALKGQSKLFMAEIRDLSIRTSAVEDRADDTERSLAEANRQITALHDDNLHLQLKMEDLENRARRSNLRIRGIPEHMTDVSAASLALFQELVPTLPPERLEMDRVHRALQRPRPDGPPRDIVIKFHYYRTKELILQHARDKAQDSDLTFQGHRYQIFNDLAPTTIARRRELKPFLDILRSQRITYRWGFPFKLIFTFQGKAYIGTTPSDVAALFDRLQIRPVTPHSQDAVADSPQKKRPRKIPNPPTASGPPIAADHSEMS